MLSSSLAELDPAHPIHPVMSYRGHEAAGVRVIRAGQRATITDGEGRHRLAAAFAERAPGDLNHVNFTRGGSDAVDSTVRFVRHDQQARGKPEKEHFISRERGYRGSSTVGAGLTALAAFHDGFGVPYDWQHKIPSRYTYRNPSGLPRLPIIRWWARCVASACWPASNS